MHKRRLILVVAAIVAVAAVANSQDDTELGERSRSALYSAERASCARLVGGLKRVDRLLVGVNTLLDEMFETQSEIVRNSYLRLALERGDVLTEEAKTVERQLSGALDAGAKLDQAIEEHICMLDELRRGSGSCGCFDGRDNDGDGEVDSDDPQCYESGRFVPTRSEHES